MSKEKPEASDVWQHKESKIYIYIVDVYTTYVTTCHSEMPVFIPLALSIENLLTDFTYLGKSKVNLEELFDVREN